ncbi:MAG TPA: hypothetical protein VK447_12475 [Myxococcaceae bacterium]|nr:hypothetical protein [Myxococcaceae bacterium]
MASASDAIAQKAREVEPGTFRHTVLLAAKRFKSSWAELGKLLVRVREESLYEKWGYDSFETYCLKEIHIRKQTAAKLTRSFSFLQRHEPQAAQDEEMVQRAPPFEVVEVLADAEERGQLSPSEYKDIRDSIWNPERPVAELKREFTERFPRPPPEPPADSLQLRRLASQARKLAGELRACRKVPQAVSDRAAALASDVEELASSSVNDG